MDWGSHVISVTEWSMELFVAQAKTVRYFLSCMALRGQADVGLGTWKVGEVFEDTIVQRYSTFAAVGVAC